MKIFDKDGDGFVGCPEFLSTFLKIHQQEKSRALERDRRACELIHEMARKKEQKTIEDMKNRSKTHVKWPKIPDDETDMVESSKISLSPIHQDSNRSTRSKVKSLLQLFPKASQETKDFIANLEEEEREIKRLELQRRTKKSQRERHNLHDSTNEKLDTNINSDM